MATEQAKAATDTSAAAPAKPDAGNPPQIDIENVTMEQLENLFERGSAELPVKSGGEEKKVQEDTSKAKEAVTAKAGDEPPKVVEAPPKVDPPEKVEEVVESRTDEEVEAAVTEAVEAVKAEGGDQAAQDAAAEEARKPAAKAVEAAKVEPAKVEPKTPESKRFRVKDPIAQAALELYKVYENTETPITLAEAEKRVRGGDQPPKKEEAAGPDLKTVVGTLTTEVADIEKKLEEAGGAEGLYTPEIAKLTVEHTRKVAELESAKRDLRDEAAATQQEAEERASAFKNTVAASREKAKELYPDVADDTTPLGKAVSERIVAMRSPDHPDHNLLFTGSAPETITMLEAAKLGIQPTTKKVEAPPPVKKPEIPPKARKVEPVSGVKTAAGKGPTPEDAKNTVEYLKSDKASLEDLDDAFGAKNPLLQIAV